MISFLRGTLAAKTPNSAVVECGGVGYEVLAPLTITEHLPEVGAEVFLLTEHVVREDAQTLYGFLLERERRVFRRLIKVSGIGAKTALAMMSAMNTEELLAVLAAEDVARLALVPGIGRKTADRLIVDFRGSDLLTEAAVAGEGDNDAEQALLALGYKKTEARKALSQIAADAESTADKVRAALRLLSRR